MIKLIHLIFVVLKIQERYFSNRQIGVRPPETFIIMEIRQIISLDGAISAATPAIFPNE